MIPLAVQQSPCSAVQIAGCAVCIPKSYANWIKLGQSEDTALMVLDIKSREMEIIFEFEWGRRAQNEKMEKVAFDGQLGGNLRANERDSW